MMNENDHPMIERTLLSFKEYGDYRRFGWWAVYRVNRFAIFSVLWLIMFVLAGLFDGNMWLLLYAAAMAATVVRYFILAVADSKSGSGLLSWRTLRWWMVLVVEVLAMIVYAAMNRYLWTR